LNYNRFGRILWFGSSCGREVRMAFVPGYEQDVFISYAHADDRPYFDPPAGEESRSGWVGTLVRQLKNELAQKIGREDACKVWFDNHRLRGNHTLSEEIAGQLERSATFVAIVSPGYSASSWCLDELRLFTRRFAGDLGRRVFIIEKSPLEPDEPIPPELRELFDGHERRALCGYRLWYEDRNEQPRTFAIPVPVAGEREYFRRIEDLAHDLKRQLKAMRLGPSGGLGRGGTTAFRPLTGAPADGGAFVLLAEVTDDLYFKRLEVHRYLEQHGLAVLPEASYLPGRAEFTAALEADLARSSLFVQLLGPMPGKRPRDVPEGYGSLQLECALRRGCRVLQWRSPDLDLARIKLPRQRALLEHETVQATSLESFKREVCIKAVPTPSPADTRRDLGGRPLVFLNTEPRHRIIASQIRAAIGNRAAWAEPLFEGDAEEVREELTQNLIDCDAMVMIYADNPGWARGQLRQFHKLAPRRTQPVRAIPVIDAPPATKPPLGIELPEMIVINGRNGIGPEALAQLSASLRL
jgi:hypothetical protein